MKVTKSDQIQLWKAVQRYFKIAEGAGKADPEMAPFNAVVDTLVICAMAVWPSAVPYEVLEKIILRGVLPELARSREEAKS
jgi:hypothetical protein